MARADTLARMERVRPPEDVTPLEFFTRWVPEAVAADASRQARLADTEATVEFTVEGEAGGTFTLEIRDGRVSGAPGAAPDAELRVRVDIDTWRALNRGDIAAPEAVLRRKLVMEGNFLLGLKLHLILG
jgi:putative sterol carrier protein